MGRGVLPEFAIIVRLREHLTVSNDHGGNRHFPDGRRTGRFFQGDPHKGEVLCVLVSWHCCLLSLNILEGVLLRLPMSASSETDETGGKRATRSSGSNS